MKFSESWLRTLVNPPISSQALCDGLTMAGLEVEGTEPAAPAFSGVVVARILKVDDHPNADRLHVCTVDVGRDAPLQIVCGAPNAAENLVVPCAVEGAVLPGDFKIKKTKMRGVESCGMLCSARELGISDDHAGLLPLPDDLKPGTDIREALGLDDTFIELSLTPNRADCLSLFGVAREVSAFTGLPVQRVVNGNVPVTSDAKPKIQLNAPEACPRFTSRIIENVNPNAETPLWMRERLRSAGIRAISPLVDITNYVMMELGQPMHAYDCARLEGDVVVRFAHDKEELLLLNEQTLALTPDLLMICDEKKPIGLAGIMGGEYSGIGDNTTRVLLEAAHFAPDVVAGKMRRFGFVSDAGYRFERGVDFELPLLAIERAAELVLQICGGNAGPVVDEHAALPARPPVNVRTARVSRLLGWNFSADEIAEILTRFQFKFTRSDDHFTVTPPSYRFDLAYEEDFVEEIARMHGYNAIPEPTQSRPQHMLTTPEETLPVDAIRERMSHLGWQEIITFSFVASDTERLIHGADYQPPVALQNPIAAQLDVMRTFLLTGLLDTLKTNLSRKETFLRLFEVGRVFNAKDADVNHQPYHLGGVAYGAAMPEQWSGLNDNRVDFFDVKGALEELVAPRTLTTEAFAEAPAFLHPRRSAAVFLNGQEVGFIGVLHPKLAHDLDLPQPPVVFELSMAALQAVPMPRVLPVSRQPMARRDLAVIVDKAVPAQHLIDTLEGVRPAFVENIAIFDIYQGKSLPDDKKSVAIQFLMRDIERTLEEADIDATMTQFFETLTEKFGAELRG
jgi:phenylalanyl-tRNA synthetase beta chain